MGFFSALLGNAGIMDAAEIDKQYSKLFTDDEVVEIGFKLIRDVFIFTNKRLILIDKQGITGKKVKYISIAYKNISRFSVENTGHFDLDAELKIWISSEENPSITKKFNTSVDVFEVQKILAKYTC